MKERGREGRTGGNEGERQTEGEKEGRESTFSSPTGVLAEETSKMEKGKT